MGNNRYLRPMGLGEILDSAVGLYRKNFFTLVMTELPMTLFYLVTTVASLIWLGGIGATNLFDIIMGSTAPAVPVPEISGRIVVVAMWLSLAMSLVMYPLVFSSVIKVASDSILGKTPSIKDAYTFSIHYLGKLILTNLVVYLILALVVAIFISVPVAVITFRVVSGGITGAEVSGLLIPLVFMLIGVVILAYLRTLWVAVFPVAVNERIFITGAMRRSWDLVKGNVIRTFLALALVYLIPTVVQLSPSFIEFSVGRSSVFLTVMVGVVAQGVLIPLADITRAVIYFELRARKEGFDLEQKVDQLQPM